eukprot:Gb_13677 [translate_table: standard]
MKILVVLCICVFVRRPACDAQVWKNCGQNKSSNGVAFQRNLEYLLDSLVDNISSTGYKISSYGEKSESGSRVYAIIQCRPDLIVSDCKQCAAVAKSNLSESCRNTSGLILLGDCFLRYDNMDFISNNKVNNDTYYPSHRICNGGVTSSPKLFSKNVKSILSDVTSRAQSSPRLFAGGVLNFSFIQIYALAQCWRHVMSAKLCESCLSQADSDLLTNCHEGAIGAQTASPTCYLRYEVYIFFNTSLLPPAPATASAPEPKTAMGIVSPNRKRSKGPIIAGLVAAAIVVFIVILLIIWKRKSSARWQSIPQNRPGESNFLEAYSFNLTIMYVFLTNGGVSTGQGEGTELLHPIPHPAFPYNILRDATQNFHVQSKLGEGGFGSVHKGNFSNKLIGNLSRVQHRNLVKLLGCCVEGSERLLVYEYLPNKSLDQILFDPTRKHVLDWKVRYNIIVGTARGLAYLHEESEIRIIHRDIKASNLLLDDKFKPKIADFGLARFIAENLSHISTRVAGTLGYMAPEYALHGQLTEKSDIFSFGVLVLEIASGRRNQETTEYMRYLVQRAWRLYESNRLWDIINEGMSCSVEEATRVAHIGLLCTQASPALRPPMSRVVQMLTSDKVDQLLPVATSPAFIDLENLAPASLKTSSTSAEAFSTSLQGR